MRSFRELFVQQCALAIFTAANEHEEGERERKVLQKVDREREEERKKEESDGNPTRPTFRRGQ